MKLSEVMETATPGPLIWASATERNHCMTSPCLRTKRDDSGGFLRILCSTVNAAGETYMFGEPEGMALLAHWYNVGPKLLEALQSNAVACGFELLAKKTQDRVMAIIAEAEEVKGI